jgi:hypothetical protein
VAAIARLVVVAVADLQATPQLQMLVGQAGLAARLHRRQQPVPAVAAALVRQMEMVAPAPRQPTVCLVGQAAVAVVLALLPLASVRSAGFPAEVAVAAGQATL